MGASVSFRYNKRNDGLWILLLGIPLLIAYGAGLILIIIGAIRMKGFKKAKKIRKNGEEGYGQIAYKIYEHDEKVTLLSQKRVVFYYQLENGLLGRTSESIDKKTYQRIVNHGNIVPIKRLGNRAVLDFVRLEKEPETQEKELDFSSQDPAYRYRYGEITKKTIVLLSIAVGLILLDKARSVYTAYVLKSTASYGGAITNVLATTIVLNNALYLTAIILYIIGVSRLPFYGIAKKIRKDGQGDKIGHIIPIVNKKNGNTTLALPHKAIFQYEAENGLLIQSTQVISKKMFNKIMDENIKDIPIKELNNYAVIDNEKLLGKEPTKLDKIFGFINKYHIFFWFAVISNIYFLVTEILNYISSSCTDGISLFTIIVYSLTLIYISLMELFDFLNRKSYWAYLLTILFFSVNIVATIVTVTVSFIDSGLNFTHSAIINWFGFGNLYLIYMVYKCTKSVINSKKAKRLDLDYERCQDFGDIISNIYTLFNYFVWTIMSLMGTLTITTLDNGKTFGLDTMLFLLIILVNFILSIIFIIKCGVGVSKETKMKKEDIKE